MAQHENLISVPPDGGWGWVIVGVSFYGMGVIDVPALGFQIVEDELMELLSLSAAEVSIFFSMYTCCMFLMGPVAGGVCNRFGFRMTAMIGCFLMITGLGTSYFVTNYFHFLILYGLMAGCGTSFILIVANVATGFWFESKRTIAIGIVSSASGASVFTLPLFNYIADEYGWRYCFLAWAGMIFILFLGSFLLAPPPMVELESVKPLTGPSKEVDLNRITVIIPLEYEKAKVQKMSNKKLKKMSTKTGIPIGRVSRPSITPAPAPVGIGKWCAWFLCCNCCQQSVGSRPLYRKDIFSDSPAYTARKEKKDRYTLPLTMTELPTTKDVAQEVECKCAVPEAVTRAMKKMIDWSLLRSGIFLLLLASSVSIFIVRYVPFLILKKYNLGYMNNEEANQTLRMMGIGCVIARLSIGFILYYFTNVSALAATIFVTLTGGSAVWFLTLYHTVLYQNIMCFLAGALTSVVITVRSLIIIDLLGLKRLTSCTGLLFFLQGFACFIGMPIAEMLREKTGSHAAGLIFTACCFLLAGLFNICIAFVSIGMTKP